MKNLLISVGLVLAVAAAAGVVAYRKGGDAAVERALAERDAMAWLKADFGLTEEQFAGIKALHDDYSVVCAEHCLEIQKASAAVERLKAQAPVDATRGRGGGAAVGGVAGGVRVGDRGTRAAVRGDDVGESGRALPRARAAEDQGVRSSGAAGSWG